MIPVLPPDVEDAAARLAEMKDPQDAVRFCKAALEWITKLGEVRLAVDPPDYVSHAWGYNLATRGRRDQPGSYYAAAVLDLWQRCQLAEAGLELARRADPERWIYQVYNGMRSLAYEHLEIGTQCEAAGNAGGAAHMRAVAGLLFSFATRGVAVPVPPPALGATVTRNETVLEQALREALDLIDDTPVRSDVERPDTDRLRAVLPESHNTQAELNAARKAFGPPVRSPEDLAAEERARAEYKALDGERAKLSLLPQLEAARTDAYRNGFEAGVEASADVYGGYGGDCGAYLDRFGPKPHPACKSDCRGPGCSGGCRT